jgi:hypothetical protein
LRQRNSNTAFYTTPLTERKQCAYGEHEFTGLPDDWGQNPVPDIVVNLDGFTKWRRRLGIDTDRELARRMGMNVATVSRALSGKAAPGRRFIAAALKLFGVAWFSELFNVVD